MVPPARFELATSWLAAGRSFQAELRGHQGRDSRKRVTAHFFSSSGRCERLFIYMVCVLKEEPNILRPPHECQLEKRAGGDLFP